MSRRHRNTSAATRANPIFNNIALQDIGNNSSYNALNVTLRRALSQGVQFDFNYTYSKSIDVGSNAERINLFASGPQSVGSVGGFASQVINSWAPKQLRAVSDFDTTHAINANLVYELPFGRGKSFGSGMNRLANAVVGGWTLSGVTRWSSGYPFTVGSGFGWATNFELESAAILNTAATPQTGTYIVTQPSGSTGPNVFRNPGIANTGDVTAALNAFRQSFPGESGQRNELRGPGTFNIDTGLSKSWHITEAQAIKFTWETFNVTNSPRFDVGTMQLSGNNSISNSTSFGNFASTLSNPRVMEFAIRFTF